MLFKSVQGTRGSDHAWAANVLPVVVVPTGYTEYILSWLPYWMLSGKTQMTAMMSSMAHQWRVDNE